jgi:hypothetical protein
MKPRTLALATFAALFGATASFGAFANDTQPVDETGPVTGHSLDPADPATTPAELYETDKSLAAETMDDDDSDDDADDDADDDDAIDDVTDDAATEAAAADEAAATDPTLTQTTAETTIPAQTGAHQPRAPSDVARMDTDGNGTLELGEISDKSALKTTFTDYDLDRDGSLSVSEFASWLGPDNATTGIAAAPAPADSTTTTTTTDATVMSSDDDDPALAASSEELEPSDTESEDIGGEKDRPSDAGTPDVDSDEEEAADPDDNDD